MNSPKDLSLLGKYSHENYNSGRQAFFIQDHLPCAEIIPNMTEVNKYINNVPLPKYLVDFYRYIKNARVEYYFGVWTLMSLKNIEERYTIVKSEGQTRVIDFAFMGIGGGHNVVASIDPKDNKIFFRNDGGNNMYEREDHWNFIKNYNPRINDKLDFNEWLKLVTGNSVWSEDINRYIVNLPYKIK